jgi:Ca2+-binding RTX toxin-like protein
MVRVVEREHFAIARRRDLWEREKHAMLKKMVLLTIALCAVLSAGVAFADDSICSQDNALANAAWDNGWCGDEAPAPKWADFEDTLQVPYEESVVIDENGEEDFGETELSTMSAASADDGVVLTLSDSGNCDILGDGTPNNPYRIVCTNWGGGDVLWYRVGQSATTANRIVACRSTDSGTTWTVDGWADSGTGADTITRLYVNGSDVGNDTIAFVRLADATPTGTACDYAAFPTQFTTNLEIDGRTGADVIFGSEMRDTSLKGEYIAGYGGNDTITLTDGGYPPTMTYYYAHGGPGNDAIGGTNVSTKLDTIVGGEGVDTIQGYAGVDDLYGYSGNDTIYGGAGNDTIHGGDNDDTIRGDDGNDTIYGDNGIDHIYGGNGVDHMYGGNDNDFLYGNTYETTPAADYLYGESGTNDVLLENNALICDGGLGGSDQCSCLPVSAEVNCELD